MQITHHYKYITELFNQYHCWLKGGVSNHWQNQLFLCLLNQWMNPSLKHSKNVRIKLCYFIKWPTAEGWRQRDNGDENFLPGKKVLVEKKRRDICERGMSVVLKSWAGIVTLKDLNIWIQYKIYNSIQFCEGFQICKTPWKWANGHHLTNSKNFCLNALLTIRLIY